MAKLRCTISMSVDGYVAGPNQSVEHPLGEGGERLHAWVVELTTWREMHGMEGGEVNVSNEVLDEVASGVGATIMGRNMFGGGPGAWGEEPWQGWWGDEPPFHMPVFVLTHHEREPLKLADTTFNFVTDGVESALAQATEAADGKDVAIGGGAETIQQYLAAGLLDELYLHVPPVLLGGGSRLFENGAGAGAELELSGVVEAPKVTHLRYRISS